MIKKRKIITFIFLIIFLFSTSLWAKDKTINLWISWEGKEKYIEIAEKFQRETGIKVNINSVPKLYDKVKTVAKGGGLLPDIAITRNTYIGGLKDLKIIYPIPESLHKGLSEKGKMAFTYHDKLFGIPFYFDVQVIYYNPFLLKKANLSVPSSSWTLKDMEEYGRKLKKLKGIIPLVWGAYSPYYFAGFEYSFKKDCIKCERERFFSSATAKAILFYKKLLKEGIGVGMDRNAILAKFKDGKAGFIIFGSFIIPDFIKDNVSFGILPLPVNSETGRRVASYLDYKGFVVFHKIKNGDEVYKFLKFIKDPEIQFEFSNPLYKFPDNKEAQNKVFSENSYLSHLRETVNSGILMPKDPIYEYYNKALANVLKLVLKKNIPIEKAFSAGRKYLKGREK